MVVGDAVPGGTYTSGRVPLDTLIHLGHLKPYLHILAHHRFGHRSLILPASEAIGSHTWGKGRGIPDLTSRAQSVVNNRALFCSTPPAYIRSPRGAGRVYPLPVVA